jgi:uncharacterized protein with PIN domain
MNRPENPPPRFLVDQMMIKLGTYLRILGYDAEWDVSLRTQDLVRWANRENRIFLTRNQRIHHEYPPVQDLILLLADDPVKQLHDVVTYTALDTQRLLFSRCIRCNVALDEVHENESIRDRVHPNVFARHETFYTCPSCGTVFWRGSHVVNTCRKLGLELEDRESQIEDG